MKTDWTEEKFSGEPLRFVQLNDSVFLQRKNIQALPVDPEYPDSDPGYVCESRKISKDVYEDLITSTPIDDEVTSNMFDIMEAIADIYTILEGGMI